MVAPHLVTAKLARSIRRIAGFPRRIATAEEALDSAEIDAVFKIRERPARSLICKP